MGYRLLSGGWIFGPRRPGFAKKKGGSNDVADDFVYPMLSENVILAENKEMVKTSNATGLYVGC